MGRAGLVDGHVSRDRPLGPADRVGSLVELGRHIEVVDRGLAAIDGIEADQGVDLEISEMEVDIDGVKADEEVHEGLLLGGGNVLEQGRRELLARREWLADRNVELECLGVNIADVDTTFVGEEDGVTLTLGVDADVILGVGRVG